MRNEEVDGKHFEVDELNRQMQEINDEINYLLDLNKGDSLPAADKEANIQAISGLREEYFEKMDETDRITKDIDEIIARHDQERADEYAQDERDQKVREEQEGFDRQFNEANDLFRKTTD